MRRVGAGVELEQVVVVPHFVTAFEQTLVAQKDLVARSPGGPLD